MCACVCVFVYECVDIGCQKLGVKYTWANWQFLLINNSLEMSFQIELFASIEIYVYSANKYYAMLYFTLLYFTVFNIGRHSPIRSHCHAITPKIYTFSIDFNIDTHETHSNLYGMYVKVYRGDLFVRYYNKNNSSKILSY